MSYRVDGQTDGETSTQTDSTKNNTTLAARLIKRDFLGAVEAVELKFHVMSCRFHAAFWFKRYVGSHGKQVLGSIIHGFKHARQTRLLHVDKPTVTALTGTQSTC